MTIPHLSPDNKFRTSTVLNLGEKLTIILKDPMTVKIDCTCCTVKLIHLFIRGTSFCHRDPVTSLRYSFLFCCCFSFFFRECYQTGTGLGVGLPQAIL